MADNGTAATNRLVPALLRKHPALLVTLVYAGVSMIGMLFSWSLFSEFGVNYFNYAEVSDFLMAALREPMTFPLAGGAILVTLAIHALSHLEQVWFARHPPKWRVTRLYQRSSSWAYKNLPVVLAVFALYAYLFLSLYGAWKSEQIKSGNGKRVAIELAGGGGFSNAALLGTSNKFVFVYDAATAGVSIVPNENIARIVIADDTG